MRSLISQVSGNSINSIGGDGRNKPRSQRMRVVGGAFMVLARRISILACLSSVAAGAALAFDPPRIIGVLTSPQGFVNGFADDYCWIGDQNGDGFDDLLVNDDQASDTLSKVYLFNGGDTLTNNPSFTFTAYEEELWIGRQLKYLGRVDEGPNRVAFLSVKRNRYLAIDQYSLGPRPSNEPLNRMRGVQWNGASVIRNGYIDRPKDINGDGFSDFVFVKQIPPNSILQVCYGGEDFDTLADWEAAIDSPAGSSGITTISGGYDINNDGYDDMLAYLSDGRDFYYTLYLGGNPPDTLPAFRIELSDYRLTETFAMLPDINGDGYDDFGIVWVNYDDIYDAHAGVRIFLGSENPDGEPDLNLESRRMDLVAISGICGGDFNGDGVGDLAICDGGGIEESVSRLSIHLGNRWFADGHQPDIFVSNFQRMYGFTSAHRMGGAGDYNGDGCDDFVAYLIDLNNDRKCLGIFAGNRDWELSVPKERAKPEKLELDVSVAPNPFNNTAKASYSLSRSVSLSISLYDINGKLIKDLGKGVRGKGEHQISFNSPSSGLYLLVIQSEDVKIIRKLVSIR